MTCCNFCNFFSFEIYLQGQQQTKAHPDVPFPLLRFSFYVLYWRIKLQFARIHN